jgi:type IV pilus assembly protein PilY1
MFKSINRISFALSLGLFATFDATQINAITLADQPLFIGTTFKPNLMYILDDSSSMFSEVMPESLTIGPSNDVLVYPWAQLVYHNSSDSWINSNGLVAKPSDIYGKLVRSKLNTLYYDPSKLYKPWISTDGATEMLPADPVCALHNPMKTGVTPRFCRNLTTTVAATPVGNSTTFDSITRTWVICNSLACGGTNTNTGDVAYYPATYYTYSGSVTVSATNADLWDNSKYTEVRIDNLPIGEVYSSDGRGADRTDCATIAGVVTCTYDQEIKNFANWYTYYRSRILTARGGSGRAFSKLELESMRVGYAQLNKASTAIDGVNTTMIMQGVRSFTAAQRTTFLTALYNTNIPKDGSTGYTPLRTALEVAGKYYQRDDTKSPWADDPFLGQAASNHASCRNSNTLLMTDGYWNNGIAYSDAAGDADYTAGESVYNPKTLANENTYVPGPPFRDGASTTYSNTLADVAMQYWKTDLRKASGTDLSNDVRPNAKDPAFWQHMTTFTVGLGVDGTVVYPNAAIAAGTFPAWPNPGAASATNPEKADDLLHAAVNGRGEFFNARDPDTFANSLAEALKQIGAAAQVGNASAAAANSTSLNNESVVYQALFDSKDWSGQLVAKELNPDGSITPTPLWTSSIPATRNIFTNGAAGGLAFTVANFTLLTVTQQAALVTTDRLKWVRGEAISGMRTRTKMLGDIVNSDPAFAGRNNLRYDRLPAALGGTTYTTWYNANKKNRREVLYVGSNDGMLHAFNAHVPETPTDSVTAKTQGEELFAYVPSMIYDKFVALSSPTYTHRPLVDGPTYVSDAYFGGAWHSILVGTLGGGGRGIYVLDVTNPETTGVGPFGPSKVLFELDSTRYPELGNITGQAIIAPGKDNRWKIFIGNGHNSSNAALEKAYLAVIDIESEVTKEPVGSATNFTRFVATDATPLNGLSQPALLPDAQGRVAAAYAGDMQGNLWKFSSDTSGAWTNPIASSKPLFVARDKAASDATAKKQPITGSPTLGVNTLVTPARVMVYFGTGRYLTAGDAAAGTDVQSFYAIVDRGTAITGRESNFHVKSFTGTTTRTISNETTGSGASKTSNVNWLATPILNGWYIDFNAGERIITKPLLLFDRLIFPTLLPSSNSCNSGGSGWLMEMIGVGNDPLDYTVLDSSGNKKLDQAIVGRLTPVESGGKDGTIVIVGIKTDGGIESSLGKKLLINLGRLSWRELQ